MRFNLSHDGAAYLAMMRGETVHRPFATRVLVPTLARLLGGLPAFIVLTRASLIGTALVFAATLDALGFAPSRIAAGIACLAVYAWLGPYLWEVPILTDGPMHFALALGVYGCVQGDVYLYAAAFLLATFAREYAMVLLVGLGAVFLWWPAVLGVGLLGFSIYWLASKQIPTIPPPPGAEALFFGPLRSIAWHCFRLHGRQWLNPLATWGPLGVFAILGAFQASPGVLKLCVLLPLAYVQPLFGTDYKRLQSHAWPAVVALAISV